MDKFEDVSERRAGTRMGQGVSSLYGEGAGAGEGVTK